MNDPQSDANAIRELVSDSESLHRLGVEVIRAIGSDDELTIRAQYHGRVIDAHCETGWREQPVDSTARSITADLIAGALATPPHARPLPARPPEPVPPAPPRRASAS